MEKYTDRQPAEAPTKATKESPEETIRCLELIGFITLLAAYIDARDDEGIETMKQVYKDVLRRFSFTKEV